MQLGNNIQTLRKRKGLSQEKLAEKINVTRQTISNWELGETSPNPEQLKLLSKELNVSIDELLEKASENYYGSYDSDEDFAESFLNEIGAIPENLPNYVYIDWERTSRDLMFDFSSSGNHYFRNY